LGSGIAIKLAIKKYGKDNFKNEIIEYCDNAETLNNREIYWIEFFDARNELVGYNLAAGGSYLEITDEHKKNISKHHADVSGEKNPMFGKTHSDLAKENLRIFRTGLKLSEETKLKQSKKRKGNMNPNAKLTSEIVNTIRNEYKNGIETKCLAKKYEVNKPCIWKIVNNRTWKHLINNNTENGRTEI
jgi:group I intron endonuclease